ncbi:MAG: histidine phosphatase family protein, partial [Oscillospiraceae bacterium]
PMKRCLETAAILYPHRKPLILSAFRECDFGDFEGKNYAELNGQSDYQRFIDHIGGIPHGETPTNFQKRCCEGFLDMGKNLREKDAKTVSVVCHGGIIMAVFDRFEVGKKGFYGYQVKNGCGFRTAFDPDTNALTILEEY